MNPISSSSVPIVHSSSISLGSVTLRTASNPSPILSPFSVSTTYLSTAIYTSDVNFLTSGISYSITENNAVQVFPSVPCSISGSSTIIFSIGSYNGVIPPSWITIDSITGSLNITTPDVSIDKEFAFYINSVISGVSTSISKIIKIKVLNCNVENCQRCLSSSNSNCSSCNSGYYLHNSAWFTPSKTAQSLQTTNQAIMASVAGIVAVASVLNTSSLSSLWSMMNQVQLFFLLFLTRAFIPLDVKTIISGNSIALNLPQYFNFQKLDFYSSALSYFDFSLSDQNFDSLNIQSDSSLYNLNPTLILGILLVLFHFIILLLRYLLSKTETTGKWSKFLFIIKWIISKIFNILTFGYYIRCILEMNQFILITSVYEVYSFNLSQNIRIMSFIFAILIWIACLALIAFVAYLSFSSYETVEAKHNKLEEFFSGIKMQKKHKLYVFALLVRRALFIVLLITSQLIPSRTILIVISLLQLGYLALISFIRPFKEIKCNIIEIMNEFYFLILLSSLIYLNTESNWNNFLANVYIFTLTSNTIATFLVIFGK